MKFGEGKRCLGRSSAHEGHESSAWEKLGSWLFSVGPGTVASQRLCSDLANRIAADILSLVILSV